MRAKVLKVAKISKLNFIKTPSPNKSPHRHRNNIVISGGEISLMQVKSPLCKKILSPLHFKFETG
jgi:hypothetical protein